jgi:hypothetical protein
MKGLHCNVFVAKDFPDCSCSGLSSRVSNVTLVNPPNDLDHPCLDSHSPIRRLCWDVKVAPVSAPDAKAPPVVLRSITLGDQVSIHAVPLELADQMTSFGGAFIYTSDSRFPSHPGDVRAPIPLHDRVERNRP